MAREHTIAIKFDLDSLGSYTDCFLAQLWHVAQANQVPISDEHAGEIAEHVGREIIRRWLSNAPADLWSHQGNHAWWSKWLALKEGAAAASGEVSHG